jgi:Fe-S-cluster containining protein
MPHAKRGAKGKRKNALSKTEVIEDVQIVLTGIQYQFKCQRCGTCCVYNQYIGIAEHEIPKMAKALDMDVQEFQNRHVTFLRKKVSTGDELIDSLYPDEHYVLKPSPPCPFFDLDTRLCKIYEARPAVCRLFPFANLRMVDIDWESRTLTFRCTSMCPGSGSTLRFFESTMDKYNEALGHEIPEWTQEEARQDRSIGINVFCKALALGHESHIRVNYLPEEDASPQKAALMTAYAAYLRLRVDGWKFKFDYREAEIRRMMDMDSRMRGMDSVDEVRIRLTSADRDPCSEEEVISNAD